MRKWGVRMIKTIIFDLGKVIIPFDFKRGYTRMAPLCGYTAEEIPKRLSTSDLVTRFETGAMEPQAFVNELSAILGIESDYDQFCDIWTSIFLPETLISEEFVKALRRKYRMLVLSNTNAIHFEMVWKAYPILHQFHDYVLSYKVGALKPSPLIYREAIRKAQCAPEQCFFTDDIAAYVEGARQEGIDAVQFENAAQIERELQNRGISW
jgi:FMN phosphatase YigB (HAD superfamily)